MLRTLVVALAVALPSVAAAEQFPQSAIDAPVVADNGVVVGRVAAVERNAEGQIVSAEIPGLEPGDAPSASRDLVAENDNRASLRVYDRREREDRAAPTRVTLR
ncbi:MAG: hypothetical protein AB7O98_06495 [Hyphomonadaceae bacterium]